MDVRALITGMFGKQTRLVRQLAREIERLTQREKRLVDMARNRRLPVLVVCEPSGDVWVCCDAAGIDLRCVSRPIGLESDAMQRYLEHVAGERHRGLLYRARDWQGPFNRHGCRTVEQLLAGRLKAFVVRAVEEAAELRREWDDMMTEVWVKR